MNCKSLTSFAGTGDDELYRRIEHHISVQLMSINIHKLGVSEGVQREKNQRLQGSFGPPYFIACPLEMRGDIRVFLSPSLTSFQYSSEINNLHGHFLYQD